MPAHPDTYARFYKHPQLQGDGSYKDADYVEIMIKGNKNTSFSKAVEPEDKINYPKAWEAYQHNFPESFDGNPIQVLPGVGPSQVMNLKALGIYSVEDVANLGEPGINDVPGGRTLQKRARAWLAALKVESEAEAQPEVVNVGAMESNPLVERTERKKPGPRPKNRVEEDEAA